MAQRKILHFRMLAYTFMVIAIGTNIPAPLYSVYRSLWGFSSGTTSLIFAVYALFLIPSLLIFGQLSDIIGRKKVLITGVLLVTIGSVLFSFAHGILSLFVARSIQGIAAGMLNGVTTAALVELHPLRDRKIASFVATVSMSIGTAVGPLLSGIIAQYGPYPIVLPYVAHMILILPGVLGVITLPETVSPKTHKAWRIQRPSVPEIMRKQFTISCMTAILCWAIMALFMSLVPAYVSTLIHVQSLVVAGGVTFVIFAASSGVQFVFKRFAPQKLMSLGLGLLICGLSSFVVSIPLQSLSLMFTGAIITGAGHGLSFMGSMTLVTFIAPPERRGDVISSLYVGAYAGVGLPIVVIGYLAQRFGLYHTLVTFSLIIGIASLLLAFTIVRKPELCELTEKISL